MNKIGIMGGGVWGTALAKILSKNRVTIYARDVKTVDSINNHKFNPKLKYVIFNENVQSTLDIRDLQNTDYLFIALPAQNIREVLTTYKFTNSKQKIIIASKGIEINSCLFLSQVIKKIINSKNISIISGPCFSSEVSQSLPTAVTLASPNKKSFDEITELFDSKNFRLYFSNDIIGCQIGGALKNIYAIAAGITYGLNLGENARSALISRSFVEMSRFGNFLGAQKNTIFGLSCLGDLILTCNSLKSRNTNFGYLISSQPKVGISDHLKSQNTTEGYHTAIAVYKIAKENNIDMPIMNSVYNILHNGASIENEIKELLERSYKDEFE